MRGGHLSKVATNMVFACLWNLCCLFVVCLFIGSTISEECVHCDVVSILLLLLLFAVCLLFFVLEDLFLCCVHHVLTNVYVDGLIEVKRGFCALTLS